MPTPHPSCNQFVYIDAEVVQEYNSLVYSTIPVALVRESNTNADGPGAIRQWRDIMSRKRKTEYEGSQNIYKGCERSWMGIGSHGNDGK